MGQVFHNIATTALAIRKEIQERPEKVWKLNFGNRFYGILKSVENSSRDQAMAQSFKNPFGDHQ